MKKGKQWICLVLVLFAVFGGVIGQLAVQEQTQLAQKLIRLHVRANSDSETDQQRKLQVRDAVLAQAGELTQNSKDAAEALQVLSQNLPALAQTAAQALRKAGGTEAVTVYLCEEAFDTREYDTLSLPAGTYTALRIDIGQAAGHNWWCVVFPTLCTRATTQGMEQAAAAAGFSDNELALMEAAAPQVQVKFRVLEWLQSIVNLF